MNLLRRLPEAPVTIALILANVVVFGLMAAASGRLPIGAFGNETLVDAGASIGLPGWRWITAAFIHVNLLHIFMNMWALGQIGVLAERAVGRALFLASYVITGAAGNILGTVLSMAGSGPPHVSAGASGAIMGIFGIAAVFAWRTNQGAIARVLAKNVLFVLVIGIAVTAGGVVSVDNAAHIGGLVVGAVIGFGRARWPHSPPRWASVLLVGGSVALTFAAFAAVRFGGA